MKFLFGFVSCCASCSSGTRRMAEETNLLVIQEPRRRKQGRMRGRGREWRPSLTSISEDVLSAEKINNGERQAPGWRRRLERKVATLSQSDRSRSLDHEDYRGVEGPRQEQQNPCTCRHWSCCRSFSNDSSGEMTEHISREADEDRLPLTALAKGKEVEKRKSTESSSQQERRTKQRHDVNASGTGTLSEVIAATIGKLLKDLNPLDVSHPVDARFGIVEIIDGLRQVVVGQEQSYVRATMRVIELRQERDNAQKDLKEREQELLQSKEELLRLKEELSSREKVITEREKTMAARDKDLQDVRAALDAANKGHVELLKAFFCKLITTDDFSQFMSLLATTAFDEVRKDTLNNVMQQHPELNLRDSQLYGHVTPS